MPNLEMTSKQIQEQIDELMLESKTNPQFDNHRKIGSLMVSKQKQVKVEEELKTVKVPQDLKKARKELISFLRDHQNLLNGEDVQSCFLIATGKSIFDENPFAEARYEGETFDSSFGLAYWEEN